MQKPARRSPFRPGPGALVTAAFIGPGTITTCSLAGAQFGYALLWGLVILRCGNHNPAGDVGTARHHNASRAGRGTAHPFQHTRRHGSSPPYWSSPPSPSATPPSRRATSSEPQWDCRLSSTDEILPLRFWVTLNAAAAFLLLLAGSYKLIERVLIGTGDTHEPHLPYHCNNCLTSTCRKY
ncbi:MAG: hypothetical protein MZV63_32325 [Marinilabiliales bacterium]|nr:hypothetical protein [Marinilabiliales bacterium]